MRLSIIVPVYNVEKYLLRCVQSIKIEDVQDAEIILVDDGSEDTSGKICDDIKKIYSDVIVIHKKNGGLSSARNAGIDIAKGEYLCFLDSDDMLAEGFCRDMIKLTDEYKPDIISYRDSRECCENIYEISGDHRVDIISNSDYINLLLSKKMECQIWSRIYKRELFQDIRFPEKRYYEDIFTLWRLLIKAQKIISINYTYYIYNISNAGSITKMANYKTMRDMKDAIDAMCSGLEEYCRTDENIRRDRIIYLLIDTYIYIGYKLKKAQEKNIILLKKEIDDRIRKTKINFFMYFDYDWKKYIVYRMLFMN